MNFHSKSLVRARPRPSSSDISTMSFSRVDDHVQRASHDHHDRLHSLRREGRTDSGPHKTDQHHQRPMTATPHSVVSHVNDAHHIEWKIEDACDNPDRRARPAGRARHPRRDQRQSHGNERAQILDIVVEGPGRPAQTRPLGVGCASRGENE